jgi:hypothetical protein
VTIIPKKTVAKFGYIPHMHVTQKKKMRKFSGNLENSSYFMSLKNPLYIGLNHIFPDQGGGGDERMEFFYSCVPICSQWVPHDVLQVLNVFLKGVLNNTSLYLIPIAQSSHLLTYLKGGTPSSHRNGCFEEPPRVFLFFLVMGQSK